MLIIFPIVFHHRRVSGWRGLMFSDNTDVSLHAWPPHRERITKPAFSRVKPCGCSCHPHKSKKKNVSQVYHQRKIIIFNKLQFLSSRCANFIELAAYVVLCTCLRPSKKIFKAIKCSEITQFQIRIYTNKQYHNKKLQELLF